MVGGPTVPFLSTTWKISVTLSGQLCKAGLFAHDFHITQVEIFQMTTSPKKDNSVFTGVNLAKPQVPHLVRACRFTLFLVMRGVRLERPTLAGIGAGGKGTHGRRRMRQAGFESGRYLVDVVGRQRSLKNVQGKTPESCPGSRRDTPTRLSSPTIARLLAGNSETKLDAVTVSTPDHQSFPRIDHGDAGWQARLIVRSADAWQSGSPPR